ncbi:MAG TPA: polysaccharide deacetylase family protein [Solirubrobacteraceae bacterium]|nr:polysaccharide deacetylase family protein [Solirubrobacteraceae bacterium]
MLRTAAVAVAAVAILAAGPSSAQPLGASPAGGGAGGAFAVTAASLVQQGQQLSLTVRLSHSFSGAAFAHGARTLCLVLMRRSGSVDAEICVAPPARRGHPLRLTLAVATRAGLGRPHPLAAVVTRGARDELTAAFPPASFDPNYRNLRWQVRSTATGGECPGPAASSASSPGVPVCELLFPARPALAALHVPRLVGCSAGGPSLVFTGRTAHRDVALTFDDGPWPEPPTLRFVDLLARYHAPATFFEIGRQIPEYDPTGAIERRMLADGDMIGDHTWTHPDMLSLSPAAQAAQLLMTARAIRRATGFTPCLWRPPYGATDPSLESRARRLGFLTVYWSVDTRDWTLPGTAAIERAALDGARPGAIILMHFGGGPRYETLDALPSIIQGLRRRGYTLVNLAQLLGLRLIYR